MLLVVNPKSRNGARLERHARAAFRHAGVRCDAVVTEAPGQGGELAAQLASRYDAIFTLGGDGTAMEIVGALAGGDRPVGILPGGTGNLIARTLGIPLRVSAAVEALLHGDEACIDLGLLTVEPTATTPARERRFAFAAGIGIDAQMIEETRGALKRTLGVFAYALTAGRAVLRRRQFHVRIVIDGEVVEREAASVMVANFGAVLDNLVQLGPGIRADDGMLDLCVFSSKSLADSVRVLWRLARKDFSDDPCVFYRAGRDISIAVDPPRPVQADGEMLGATPIRIVVEPLAARLLVPARRS